MKVRITTDKVGANYPKGSVHELAENLAELLIRHGNAVALDPIGSVAVGEPIDAIVEAPVVVEAIVEPVAAKHETIAEYMASRVERTKTNTPDSTDETLEMEN